MSELCVVENPCMYENSLHRNWDIPCSALYGGGDKVRTVTKKIIKDVDISERGLLEVERQNRPLYISVPPIRTRPGSTVGKPDNKDRKCAEKVAWYCLVGYLLLSVGKLIIGYLCGSRNIFSSDVLNLGADVLGAIKQTALHFSSKSGGSAEKAGGGTSMPLVSSGMFFTEADSEKTENENMLLSIMAERLTDKMADQLADKMADRIADRMVERITGDVIKKVNSQQVKDSIN